MYSGNDKKNILGQYFTQTQLVKKCLKDFKLHQNIIEPSYGSGNFLKELPDHAIGIEIDTDLYQSWHSDNCLNLNFYDWNPIFTEDISFVGNPPYRTPAYSLTTHNSYIKKLCQKYEIGVLKEEALLFIIKTIDIFKNNNVSGNIGYILPKSIFTGTSKNYFDFKSLCLKYLNLIKITDIKDEFDNVNQDLVWVEWTVEKQIKDEFLLNNTIIKIDDFWCFKNNTITFMDIFKKTYLGSQIPESFLFSCNNESLINFQKRLVDLYSNDLTEHNLLDYLSYDGKPHLTALQKGNIDKIIRTLNDIKEFKIQISLAEINDISNFKEIKHRNEIRYYFRSDKLKKQKQFVYILNTNPQKSFYFPGNPTRTSTDYFGFCNYDINRNSSPGANRSVPLDNIENNLTDNFKKWWSQNTNKPYSEIFNYLLFVSKSDWYKNYKNQFQRFYFCIPSIFMTEFNDI